MDSARLLPVPNWLKPMTNHHMNQVKLVQIPYAHCIIFKDKTKGSQLALKGFREKYREVR